jgi:hypothetical protein
VLFDVGGNRSWTCRIEGMFEVELCKVFIRRADVEVKVSVTLLDSVFVWVYLKLRPWWSVPRLSFGQQQDIHTKGGIFLKMRYMLFVSSDGPYHKKVR